EEVDLTVDRLALDALRGAGERGGDLVDEVVGDDLRAREAAEGVVVVDEREVAADDVDARRAQVDGEEDLRVVELARELAADAEDLLAEDPADVRLLRRLALEAL